MSFEVELCLDSLDACVAAEQAGADRIELCAKLEIEGITPDLNLVREVREAVKIGLHVLVRPRGGNFVYSETEINQMLQSIDQLKSIGVDGIVSGALLEDGSLDKHSLIQLIETSRACSFTFHRAFDYCTEPLVALEAMNDAGVNRLLTSGQGSTALEGISLLKTLVNQESSVEIMVGGDVNSQNVSEFWQVGVRSFHFSCQKKESGAFDEEKAANTIAKLNALKK